MAGDESVVEKSYAYSTAVAGDDVVFNGTEFGDRIDDVADMRRLGKKQQFKRNFGFLSTLGFISVYMSTWELAILVLSAGVYSGGFAGLFWMFFATSIAYAPIVASLAELESMAPTSGGQYHWVSEFAPEGSQKILSYATGWMSTLAWLATQTSGPFLSITLIEVMINVFDPDYAFTRWQYTLLMLACIVTTVFFNTWFAPILPAVETIALVFHIAGFLMVIIPLWVLSPKASAHDVFVQLTNESGWSMGVALLLQQVNSLYCILGSDTAVHISEEVGDASLVVPRTMWWSYVLNFVLAMLTVVTFLFTWGPVEDAIDADVPYLLLVMNTGNTGVALMILIVLFVLVYVANVTLLATVSRETWAFARDRGFPFSKWITKMDPKTHMPFNSVYLTSFLSGLLCLINLGSTLAFNIIVSVSLLALLSSYTISIGCILWRRIRGHKLPPARWSLGRWGLLINALGFLYSLFAAIFCCFPAGLPVDTSSANYGPALWAGVIVLAVVVYIFHGKKHYTPPVSFVEGRKADGVGIQSVEE